MTEPSKEQPMIGDRLRHLRTQRGLYQADVATRADISTSYLSRLEKGERRLTERSLIVRLAEALGVSPSELAGHPIDWTDPQMADAQASIAALRLILATTQLGQRAAETPRPLAQLYEATASAVEARTACDFGRLGAILPPLIAELHTVVVDTGGDDRRGALQALFVACTSTMTLAHAQSYQMEAWASAQRAQQIADELDDPAYQAMAAFTSVHALLPMGGHSAAYMLASAAADRARGLRGQLGAHDRAEAAFGSVLLVSALTASITGRTEESADRLAEAAVVAEMIGEGSPLVATFGPTNVGIYSMASALERGDYAAAVSLGRSVDLTKIPSPERRAKFHMDTARALHGTDDDESAVVAYRRAESAARGRLYGSVYARETVADLRDRLPRDTDAGRAARELAYRMNLSA